MNITILTFESSLYNTTVRRFVALYVRCVLKRDINIPKIRTRCRIVFSHLQRINWCLCGRARDRVSSARRCKICCNVINPLLPTPLNDHVFPSIILQSLGIHLYNCSFLRRKYYVFFYDVAYYICNNLLITNIAFFPFYQLFTFLMYIYIGDVI